MLTIERTEEYILLKIPVTTTEEQLRAIQDAYNNVQPDYASLLKAEQEAGLMDEDGFITDPEVLEISREAREGGWNQTKEVFKDHPRYEELLESAGEEEE
jgi:hypothetical protein